MASWLFGKAVESQANSALNSVTKVFEEEPEPEPPKEKSGWEKFCETITGGAENIKESITEYNKKNERLEMEKRKAKRDELRNKYSKPLEDKKSDEKFIWEK
ncbi:nsun2 [Acrasis kona]|uniref:Nsun2 n=1 Tax=Acrasis kona TaxID=1008807 RepID=A0AAW2ZM11_9EUKA